MTRRFTGTLVSTLVLVLATGCGGGGSEAVAWTDEVCGALAGFTAAVTDQPTIDQRDPAAAVQGLGDYLGDTAAALQASISALDAAGPSPVDGGDEYVSRLKTALGQIRTGFVTARSQLTGVDTSSIASVTAALPAAVAPLQELTNLADPTEGLRANDALRAAADQAPNCQRLRAAS